ncbi:MAG: PDDEXK nuclease domain-containing protein [Treponema sp.]|nr:PDDEXK nuclease domain-containing protein [Treponema sp.]
MGNDLSMDNYKTLVENIGSLLSESKKQVVQTVNNVLVKTYWEIGRYIVEFEQNGKERAEYGDELLVTLSKDLTLAYGKGFSKSNLFQIRQFYLKFQKFQTLSGKLSWSHYVEILKCDDELELGFYVKQCELENWSVRELKRQMKSLLFHRIALSKDKSEVIELSKSGHLIESPEDIVKDPYVLEFLGIPEQKAYKEGELEDKIIENLQGFLLELGRGFAFIGRQYKMQIGSRQFKVDLVFYNHILKCFVLIDLKRGEIEHYDVGQMNMYLNYFKSEMSSEGDNPPIGIVLGAYKDQLLMEYATQGIENNLFVSKYQLYLPNKDELQKELEKLLDSE